MNGAIRSVSSLRTWFFDVGKPFFTLTYAGQTAQVVMRNVVEEDMEKAWETLKRTVEAQAEYGRATLQVIVYTKERGANNPDGRTNIDIQPGAQPAQAAIAGYLPGHVDESKIAGMIEEARQKWELERRLEELENQVNNPVDWTSRTVEIIEKIGATPIGQILTAKLLGVQMPVGQVAGHPAPEEIEPDNFEQDIDEAAGLLGVSDAELAAKLVKLVRANPEMARQLINAQ